jgi:hypothetical protein
MSRVLPSFGLKLTAQTPAAAAVALAVGQLLLQQFLWVMQQQEIACCIYSPDWSLSSSTVQ